MQLDKETRPKAKLLVEIEQTSHELERITQQVSRTIAENTSAQALMKSLSERLRNAQLQVAGTRSHCNPIPLLIVSISIRDGNVSYGLRITADRV